MARRGSATADRTARLRALDAMDEVRQCGGIAVDITESESSINLGPDGRFDVVLIVCGRYPPFDLTARLEGAPVVIDPTSDAEPLSRRLDRASEGAKVRPAAISERHGGHG